MESLQIIGNIKQRFFQRHIHTTLLTFRHALESPDLVGVKVLSKSNNIVFIFCNKLQAFSCCNFWLPVNLQYLFLFATGRQVSVLKFRFVDAMSCLIYIVKYALFAHMLNYKKNVYVFTTCAIYTS